ncbi:SDR family NAD(P)-dependent oxidoreductase [Seongchinamella unica]|uniref:SDR family NAD(P)-dependent oxidoreductase n=1 Tax=Seongchinamella unica TaxID=2547392 RepID=A0A4R5LRZ2_9GAMM|nr:SDR family NAD(P)-dependent oxidoreductase [Seongchinamella unica]TDG13659.1 SDR family NAD(P)-dependent oxidoreductase [Seongchinamella unica]
MRVMVTGGTGFIGYHTVLALRAAGLEVSLLVRSVAKMERIYGKGVITHYTEGDIGDADSVNAALEGCDGVVHVAALVSTRAADADRVFQTNLEGAHNVLGGAVACGLQTIIHVSSVTALYDPSAALLDEDSPPGPNPIGYGRSKVACEKYARSLQAEGHPVYITYPATVLGPDAPEMTEAHTGLETYLSKFVPLMSSGTQYVDARDIAAVHAHIIQYEVPSNRYVLGGHYLSWKALAPVLESITGSKIVTLPMSGGLMRLAGSLADRLAPVLPLDLPISREGLNYATQWAMLDNRRVETELDFQFRPVEETLADSIRWLYQQGEISARAAGRLAL